MNEEIEGIKDDIFEIECVAEELVDFCRKLRRKIKVIQKDEELRKNADSLDLSDFMKDSGLDE